KGLVMSVEHFPDHAERALSRLAGQLRSSATHKGLVLALARQSQDLEDALIGFKILRQVDDASGAQLDGIGSIVGCAREGSEDPDYRARIKAQILVNRRSGEIETLIAIVSLLLPGARVVVTEFEPAALDVRADDTALADPMRIAKLLKVAKAGGVKLTFSYSTAPEAEAFC